MTSQPGSGDRPPITFASLTEGLLWPRLWRTLPMATRPGRLIVMLIMLVVLLGFGSVYDRLDTFQKGHPAVAGAGLDVDRPEDSRIQENLRGILSSANVVDREFAEDLLAQEEIKPGQVSSAIKKSFHKRAEEAQLEADGPLTDVRWDRIRTPYSSALRDVRLLEGQGLFKTASRNTAKAFNEFAMGLIALDPSRATGAVHWWWSRTIVPMFTRHTLGAITLLLMTMLILSVFGGAVSRSTACDIAGWSAPGPGESVSFAWRKRFDFMMALLGPALFIGVVTLLLATIGAIALRIPGIDVLTAALYGIALLLGLLVAMCIFGLCLGGLMLIPSVAVECTDWLDGVQRVYAYIAGSPGRLILYLLALATQGVVAYWALSLIIAGALNFTAGSLTAWLGNEPTELAGQVEPFIFKIQQDIWALSGTSNWTAHIMGLWELAAVLLLAAGVFSYLFSGGTALYLALRQVNDHQDMADISPEMD